MENEQERGAKMVREQERGGALPEMEREQVNLESEWEKEAKMESD